MKSARTGFLLAALATLGLSNLLVTPIAIHAQESTAAAHEAGAQKKDGDKDKEAPIPPEKAVVTHHQMTLDGKTLKYTATAGTLLIRDQEDKPYGSIFYVTYTLDGAEPGTRPVSFLYNGGPGSATLWLHMGSFGPMRVETDSPKPTAGPPFKLVENQYSLLGKTDLVFIDAPLTGYSRAVGKATTKDFAGVDQDLRAFDRFIVRYLTVNERWNSPKFLIGESYGTTRSAALADTLAGDGVQLNGVVLISSILNYFVEAPGYDNEYIFNLPSYAAAAWYFNKIPNKPADVSTWVEEARKFAAGPYEQALFQGDKLPAAQFDEIAQQVSHFTGMPVQYVKEAKLRISPTRFRKEVLRDDAKILGRYDMRFDATDPDSAGEYPGYDPSDTGISGAFIASLHDYLQRDLKYESTDDYRPSARTIGQWDWDHRAAGNFRGRSMRMPYVAGDLADAIRKNPHLKVFSANGYFDLATPFFATEYDLDHMMLDQGLTGNVEFGYYPSGHMIYLNVAALKKLSADLGKFITEQTQ
ncbi:MAG: peptidase S10 [Acidobacteriota bacterium]|nr:peptidase S10 [Acidobacteriota bacterium]